ncbi:MAG: tetratricopeptide repeat protein [Magnetococcus sp. THC-1_WYH]
MMIARRYLSVVLVLLLALNGCVVPGKMPGGEEVAEDSVKEEVKSPENRRFDAVIAAHLKSGSEADRLATESVKLISEGKYEDASKKINQALQLRVDRSYYHLINGMTYHLMVQGGNGGVMDLAQQGYELAIQFDGGNWMAHYLLGRLYIDKGRYDLSVKHFSAAIALHPDDPDLLNSFVYASYRAGMPDLAAGGVKGLEKINAINSPTALRNASMVMAALGSKEESKGYFSQLTAKAEDPHMVQLVDRRLQEWDGFHDKLSTAPKFEKVISFGAAVMGGGGMGGGGGGYGGSSLNSTTIPGNAGALTAPGTEDKMVVVDVVLIHTEENFVTAKGINLLNGLQLQFGNPLSNIPAFSKEWGRTHVEPTVSTVTSTDDTVAPTRYYLDNPDRTDRSFTRALTIPAITYSLNIFNATNQRNEILARPTLVALAGQPSEFFSGLQLVAAAVSSGAQGGESVRIDKEIGVKMSVTPSFLNDGRIRLAVVAQRTFLQTPNNDVNFTFRIETTLNKVVANVVMRYGETLILGGLSEKESDNTRDGTPGLQDIPLLQYAFSQNIARDYQKSVLILLTPRPAQYTYQSEKSRQEYEKTLGEDEREVEALRSRYADWFKPYPNWASIFHHMQENSLYREFRTGDVTLENWADLRTTKDRLLQVLDFLYY